MKNRFILILGLALFILIFISSANAADSPETAMNDSSPNNSINIMVENQDQSNHTTISGKVNDCHSNDPFPGVNITVSNGEYLASTLTKDDGTYLINFPIDSKTLTDSKTFNVTASHQGHVPVTREVTINDSHYTGVDFVLGNDIYVDPKNGKSSYDGTSPVYEGGNKGPKQTLSDAISVCVSGGNLHLAAGTYKGSSNKNLIIQINLNILGAGETNTTIDAEDDGLIFWIKPGHQVNITNITLTQGKASGTVSGDDGDNGGAIYNEGTLTVQNCYLYDNHARNGNSPGTGSGIGKGGNGGAIYNTGTLTLLNCNLKDNSAGKGGDGNPGDSGKQGGNGGAILNTGTLTITNCTFEGNHAGDGGSHYNDHSGGSGGMGGAIYSTGTVNITGSNFNGNYAGNPAVGATGGYGGAVYNTGTMTLTNCEMTSNHAGKGADATAQITAEHGGYGGAAYNSGTLTLTSCTFTSNYAGDGGKSSDLHDGSSGGNGGAIYNQGTLNIQNGTFNSNHAGDGGDIESGSAAAGGSGGSGGAIYNTHTTTITNTQFNANHAGTGHKGGSAGNGGAIYSSSILSLTNCLMTGNYAGNGGASHDQKTGKAGGYGGAIYNIGTSTLTNCTLNTNHAGDGGDCGDEYGGNGGYGGAIYNFITLTIVDCQFDGNYAGTGGEASPTKAAQKGGDGGTIYNDLGGNVTITGSQIMNGHAGDGGGPQANHNAGDGGSGGAIYNLNILTINNTLIHNNQAGDGPNGGTAPSNGGLGGYGGGIYNGGILTLANSTKIYNNTAGDGGDASGTVDGTHGGFGGGIYNKNKATISDSQIYSNQAGNGGVGVDEQTGGYGGYGGGIYNEGILTILANSQINDNTAGKGGDAHDIGLTLAGDGGEGGYGGGIYNTGTLNLTGNSTHPVEITGNTAGTGGLSQNDDKGGNGGKAGGLYNKGTTCNLEYVLISGNKGGKGNTGEGDTYLDIEGGDGGSGGGIYNTGTMSLNHCNLTYNEGGDGASGMNNPGQVNYGGGEGGHGGDGGAIANTGKLTITNSQITGNQAGNGGNGGQSTYSFDGREGGSGGNGGGIYNTGQITLTSSIISDNTAGNGGKGGLGRLMKKTDDHTHVDYLIVGEPGDGGEGGSGGGIYNMGTISSITNTQILNNHAGTGGAGGLYEASTQLDIYGATPAEPGNGGSGGGIYSTGKLSTIQDTVIDGNYAGTGGDGSPCSTSPSENGGNGGNGGGVYISNQMVDFLNCLISNNQAGAGGKGGNTYVGSNYYGANQPGNGGTGGLGGGIYYTNNVYILTNINGTTINNNSAGNGGAGGIDDNGNTHSSNGGAGGNGGGISCISSLANNIELTILESTLTGNKAGIGGQPYLSGSKGSDGVGGGLYSNTNNYLTMNFCRIIDNTPQAVYVNINFVYVSILLQNNWWGTNNGPGNQISGINIAEINSTPWLVLNITSNPPSLYKDQSTTVTAFLTMNSDHENTLTFYGMHVPDGIPVSFTSSNGTLNPENNLTSNGASSSVFVPSIVSGNAVVNATVDYQTVSTDVHLLTADVLVTKTVNNTRPNVGDTITFTITLKNNGPDDATPMIITDIIPAGLTDISYSASTGSQSYSPASGLWDIAALPNGATATLNITGKVSSSLAGLNTTNYANITSQHEYNHNNPSANATFYVPMVNVSVVQHPWYFDSEDQTFQTVSSCYNTIVYNLDVTNTGADDATNVVVKELLGAGYELVGFSTEGVGTASYDSVTRTITWNIASLPAISKAVLSVNALVVGTGNNTPNLVVNASLVHVDQYNIGNRNWSDWSVYVAPSADIEVNQTQQVSTEPDGQYVTYNITATNNGPDNANLIQITDPLPAGLTGVVVADVPGTTYTIDSNHKIIWNITTINKGSSILLTVKARINTNGTLVNTATKTSQAEFDWEANNNAQTCILTLSGNYTPEVNMNVKQYPWYYNDRTDTYQTVSGYYKTMVYSVVIRNNGVNEATGVVVKEVLGDGYQFLNCTTKGAGTASFDILTNTITWNIGYMPAGGKVCLSVFVLVIATGNNTPDLTVNASLVHVDQYDIPGSAKWASYSIYVPSTLDVSLADNKSNLYLNPLNTPHPQPGENFLVTFKLGNTGPDDASNVKIKIYIPEGLEFVNASVDMGNCYYDPTTRTLIWTLPLVNVGDPYLTLELHAVKEGQYRLSPIITSTSYLLSAGNLPGSLNMNVAAGEPVDNGSVNTVNSVNAQGKSVGMQETGGPLTLLLVAILMVLGGLTIGRRD